MSRKNKKQEKETTIEDFYDLKIDKVDELVAALKDGNAQSDAPPVSTKISDCTGTDTPDTKTKKGKDKEFDPYKIDKLSRIPVWLKAFFIKFWFAGAVCYFVNMGLGVYITNSLDLMLLDGVVLGVLTDVLVNPIFRLIESDRKEYNNYMMFPFPFKKYWTFLTNIAYYIGVFFCVNYAYLGLNLAAEAINKNWFVAIEPLLFGTIALLVDMAFIGIKDLIVYLVKRKKLKKAEMLAIQREIDGVAGDADAAKDVANGGANGAEAGQAAAEKGRNPANKKTNKGKKKGK